LDYEPWYQHKSTEHDQILSSRIRLARNLQEVPFKSKLSATDASANIRKLEDTVGKINLSRPMETLVAQDLRMVDELVFLEKHIISPAYIQSEMAKGVFVDMHQNVSIMVNEEDHVRIQSVLPGNDLPRALAKAIELDDLLENLLDYAYDTELGYLTACPTNVGTGLRASYMIHLPCLESTNTFKELFPIIVQSGMTVRGLYGEGTKPMGGIYQLSNQVTLGVKEAQVIKDLAACAEQLIEHELQMLSKIQEKRPYYLVDKAHRAYGILQNSRKMGLEEAMGFLSSIRLGVVSDYFEYNADITIYEIMMEIQPGHLHFAAGKTLSDLDTDLARADYLRTKFK